VLELVGLHDSRDRKIGKLSAGMRQRLGVAQALVGNPELVLLDEPTSNLDVMARRNLLSTITDVHETEGVSFCIISHVLSELERVCTDVAFINKGRAITAGPIYDVISKHSANQFNVLLSDPKIIIEDIRNMDFVESADITGAKSITVVLGNGADMTLLDDIRHRAESRGVQVYEIEKIHSLERAFLEVMKHE
jgi:ABC-2 type transport system ATP-binding protein